MLFMSAGQVGAAYRTVKQDIAADEPAVFFVVETHRSGRVAGCEQHLERVFAQAQWYFFREMLRNDGRRETIDAKHQGARGGTCQHRRIERMQGKGNIVFLCERRDAQDMVNMGVSIQDGLRAEALRFDGLRHLRPLVGVRHTGVNNPAVFIGIREQIGVLGEGIESEGLNL